jgi:hypothetical protein
MKLTPSLRGHIFFFFLGSWLISTIFIDFFAVMAVFKNVSNIFEAGTVGMYVFSSFNKFEIIFGIFLLLISFTNPLTNLKMKNTMIIISAILLSFALYYNFFLSPKITTLTHSMHDIGMGNKGYDEIERMHGIFHKRYVSMDSIKLLLLLALLCLGIGKGKTFTDSSVLAQETEP